ncbi:MAG: hypothetical protein DRQ88_00565 [Epsilonproteobacteria bacterium]|nr:MAG: hypothetical protein DRQ89_03645 [Campylobacterota bacterium]RLA68128.1 MAG: hypothetical protein DRQ88_00565 [Campylobacterota bacterium]
MACRYFKALGKVQGVMFRQTIMRGAMKRGLKAGATNLPSKNEVDFMLEGEDAVIQEMVDFIKSGKAINDWDAKIEKLEEVNTDDSIGDYEVTTENVDSFNWSTNVNFYL